MVHRRPRPTLVLILLIALAAPVTALDAPGRKCAAAKLKATAKKTLAKFKCTAKGVAKDIAVDPACFAKAETKFSEAFAKAEAKGGCATSGDALITEYWVDSFVGHRVAEQIGLPGCPMLGFMACSTSCASTQCQRHVPSGATVCVSTGTGSCITATCDSDSDCSGGRVCIAGLTGTATGCCLPCS